MSKIAILYSTTDGHTRTICEYLQSELIGHGQQVSVREITEVASINLLSFDKIVIGASIRYGKHQRNVYQFIENHRHLLEQKPSAFFSVNVVARKPQKAQPDTNPYLNKFLQQISWQPKNLAVFGGKIDYPSYGFVDRNMIRLIMWMTNGPADPQQTIEFTDWQQVAAFADTIDGM